MNLTERIEADGMELDAEMTGEKTGAEGWRHRDYDATLTMGGRSMRVEGGYQAGMACGWPTTADVLSLLCSVATRVETTDGYEEWAREFETDPEKWQPVSEYEDSKRTTQALRTLLGDKYDAYLYETDDDT